MSAKPLWSQHDNLDDRREVHFLLSRIPPVLRIRWLKWCCSRCRGKLGAAVGRDTDGENPFVIYFDFWTLTNQYGLDPLVGLQALIDVVKAWERGFFRKGSPIHLHLPR